VSSPVRGSDAGGDGLLYIVTSCEAAASPVFVEKSLQRLPVHPSEPWGRAAHGTRLLVVWVIGTHFSD
jgi:hypothetical protein